MYNVSDKYKEISSAAVRKHDIYITVFRMVNGKYEEHASYHERQDSPIISLKIIKGQTTGGFSIGGTNCSALEITAHITAPFRVNDKIEVQTVFRTLDEMDGTEFLFLGVFYVDSITANQFSMKVTALDAMARLAKNYNSEISYPATVEAMLNEISTQSGVGLSSVDIFNNASVGSKPVKATDDQGNEVYYTRREALGYLAGINGGNAYINNMGQIAFSIPRETNYTIGWENVISQTFGGAELTVGSVILNTTGTSSSTSDDWDENAVQLYVPLDVAADIAVKTEQQLSGTHYEAITLKKQGTGMFELGDLVTYKALDGTYHKMLVMGIAYELTNGFFSETVYSLAQSASQRQYSGSQNISQNIAPTTPAAPSTPSTPEVSSEATALISNDKLYKLVMLGITQMVQDADGNMLGFLQNNGSAIQMRAFNSGSNLDINPGQISVNMGVANAPRFAIGNGSIEIDTGASSSDHRILFGGAAAFSIPRNSGSHGVLELRSDGVYYLGKKLAFENEGAT